ncbi:hypothetical protein OCK74_20300 [Chitinophagaceae bacterium LB-8]|uniref:Uncharacterized protein n=1 Tax=Paraflavisolibacter caeni TaxID=2982496 RepID=A0A9X2XPQ0_9BACT|nr:hypothetical protein [Paraflavisolibacter caeni]MCU7551474.1 hypothetical protein [Paraflavisolibacter caeni]
MEATIQHVIKNTTTNATVKTQVLNNFFQWSASQEKNRFGWLAAALVIHGCALTPITLFAIVLSGNYFGFWILALVAMGASLVTNLSALPTKITIPTFFLSVIIDIAIIISCLVSIL